MKKIFILFLFSILIVSCSNESKKENAEKLYLSAIEAYSNHDMQKAKVLVKAAEKCDSKFYQAFLLEGKINFFSEDYELAEKVFSKLCKNHREYTEAKIWLIRVKILRQDYTSARKLLDRELSYNSTDWRFYYLYSLLFDKEDNFEEEIVMLKNAETVLCDASKVYGQTAHIWDILGVEDRKEFYRHKANIIGELK